MRFIYDKEIAAQVPGTDAGTYEWQLTKPLPPLSTIRFRAAYNFQGVRRMVGKVGTWKWFNVEETASLEDMAIEWTIFADSAPPNTGRLTLGTLGVTMALV